jgi:hypothetical protein
MLKQFLVMLKLHNIYFYLTIWEPCFLNIAFNKSLMIYLLFCFSSVQVVKNDRIQSVLGAHGSLKCGCILARNKQVVALPVVVLLQLLYEHHIAEIFSSICKTVISVARILLGVAVLVSSLLGCCPNIV